MLNKNQISLEIRTLLKELSTSEDKDKAIDIFCDKLSQTIIDAIKSADVIVQAGQKVSVGTTQGTAFGATIEVGKGSLK